MTYQDPLIAFMRAHDITVDRETYLDLAFPDGVPDPWPAELEVEMPSEFQKG